jgi:hypothetical protein
MEFTAFTQALLKLMFASFFVERSLSLFFETKWFIVYSKNSPNIRTVIAFSYSFSFVLATQLNLIKYLGYELPQEPSGLFDWVCVSFIYFVTAGFVAGGSKASLKLFRDVMEIRSSYEASRAENSIVDPNVATNLANKMAEGDETAMTKLHKQLEKFEKSKRKSTEITKEEQP